MDNEQAEVFSPPQLPEQVADDELLQVLQALLLVADTPISAEQISGAIGNPTAQIDSHLQRWSQQLSAENSGIDLRLTEEGWRLYTRAQYSSYVEKLLLKGARSTLSRAALETLAVIAYRQPVTRGEISAVRGVGVDAVVRTLHSRGLIAVVSAEAEESTGGHAQRYVTTELFLERLGLSSLEQLPALAPLLPRVEAIDEIVTTELDS